MKILHYALGFPPYRTGGLTKYCTDLMLTQREEGHEVALMWPGQMGFIDKKLRIRQGKPWNDVQSFEVINPLPVALDEGIRDVKAYTQTVDAKTYEKLLNGYKPDVIHIHTLMGLHSEFLDVAKKMDIRTVFTSHDYYGLCPKVTLFHDGKPCDDDHNCADCVACNQKALSMKTIAIMQSPMYRKMKNTAIVKKIRQKHRQEFFEEQEKQDGDDVIDNGKLCAVDYQRLRAYYVNMLQKMDKIHFNSTVTEKIYRRYMEPKASEVISITHRDIKDNRGIKEFNHEKLRLTYLGPAKPFKGFQFLLEVLDDLWKQGERKFELHIYTATAETRPYITHQQDGYPYSQLEEIFDNTDLMVAPSICYETFGFTVLEALSFGVPVLVSENVGAKDVLDDNKYGMVIEVDKTRVLGTLKKFCEKCSELQKYSVYINKDFRVENMLCHARNMVNYYM